MKTEHKAPEMSGIFKELAENFISFKRNLGFKYQSEEKVMSRFCRFSNDYDLTEVCITKELAEDWIAPRAGEAGKFIFMSATNPSWESKVPLTGKKVLIMNKPTVQDIFRYFYPAYLEKYSPSPEQAKVARNILNCKTGAYGSNVSICEDCGAVQIHYNSCRNRCCPMCQAVPKEMWMDARKEDVLDAPYFHLVFTVPDILNPIIYNNQKLLYNTLYHAASATISELTADPKHIGAVVGYICILHTWGSEMNFHPHIHTILLGGGLTSKNEWKDNGTEFFLPIWAASKVFRGKYMDELKNLWNTNQLKFHGTAKKYSNHYAFKELIDFCYDAEWISYCKKTFNGAQSVIDYLGKYTHRIAISNHRIICMDDENVTFSVKDYRNKG